MPHSATFFVGIFTLLSATVLVSSVKVVIVPYGSSQLRAVGDPVSLRCSVRGQVHGSRVDMRWLDPAGQPISSTEDVSSSSRRVYSRRTYPREAQLFFSRLQEEDFGIYTCLVIHEGRYYRRSVTLQVYKPIEYLNCPETQTLYRGRPGLVSCEVTASPKPVVSWTSKGRIITTDQRNEVTAHGLKIYDVKDEDTGNYYCMATLTSQGVFKTRTIKVRVVEPPVEEARAPHIARVQLSAPRPQDDVTLTCVVAGNPAPDIEWFRYEDVSYQLVTGEGLSSVEETKQEGLTVGILHVTPGRAQEVDSYMCSALNIHGQDRQRFNLTRYNETDESILPPNIDRIHMNRTQGSFHDVMVTCIASGSPTPAMAWVRRGDATHNDPIQSRGRFVVTEDQTDGKAVLTLVIKEATPEDQGIYICSATNKKASVRQQFEFDILDAPPEKPEAPHISRVHVNRTGAGAEDTTVTCVAEGIPPPHIGFTRQTPTGTYQQLEPNDRIEVKEEGTPGQTTVSVTWKKSVSEDAGVYQCVASNIAGSMNQQFEIYAKDWQPTNLWPPQVLRLHVNRTSGKERNITVTCEAIATPTPHMNWLRHGEIIFPDERRSVSQKFESDTGVLVLGIRNARPDDDGTYTCSAVNIAGKAEQNFTLETRGHGTQQTIFHREDYFVEGTEDWSQFGHASQLRGSQWYYHTQSQQDQPGPPSFVQLASHTSNKVVLRISRPHTSKGITQYRVKYSFGGYEPTEKYVDFQKDAAYTDVALENLLPSTTYQIQVSSVSNTGQSRPLVLSFTTPQSTFHSQGQLGASEDLEWLRKKKKVPQSVPSRLEIEGVENNVRAVWLSWDWVPRVKPADYVQGFQVLYSSDPQSPYESWRTAEVTGDTSRSYIIQGLQAGQEYSFIVRGRNRHGLGPNSKRMVYRVPQVPEIPPGDFSVESVRGKPTDVRFSWTALDRENAGADVTEYRIYYSTSLNQPVSKWMHQSVPADEHSYSLTGLSPATTYYFRIQSRNNDGGSPVSSYIVYRTPTVRLSDPPSYVDVSTTSPTQVNLRINRPVNSGGYPVDGYVVEYEPAQSRRSSNRQVLDTDDAYVVDFVIRNLNPSTEYIFRVSARTRMGYSKPTELRFSTPRQSTAGYPSQTGQTEDTKWLKKTGSHSLSSNLLKPRDLTTEYDPASAKLTLRWKRPLLPTVRVKGYTVLWSPSVEGAEALVLNVPGRQTSAEITNLLPNTVYRFQVRTESSSGTKSPYTSAVTFKTPALPDPPSDLSIEQGEGDSAAIRIARPRNLMGNPLIGYRVRYFAADEEGTGSFEEVSIEASTGSVYTPINVKGLSPGIKYKFEVVSQTSAGFSSPRTIEFITPQRFQHQGQVRVEQESLGSQQSQDENLDLAWLKELERQQTQEQVTSKPGVTARPAGREPTTSYTLSWDVFQGNLAGLVKYIVSYREVNVDPVTEEVLDISSDYVHTDVDPHTHSLQLDNLVRNRHYQIEVTAISRVGPSILKYTIKKFIYWVPPKTISPPHIADIYQNKTGAEGEDVMMTCEATGSPGPRLSWLKKIDDGYRRVQTGDRFDIHEKISKTKAVTTLVIRDVTIDDYGTYACSAVSPAGNSSHNFKFMADVPVVDPQAPHVYRIHVNRTGPTGEDIMVTCKASGRPRPDMKWMRNAQTLFPSKEGRITTSSTEGDDETVLTLLIRYPVSGDAGTYHCVAKNSVGSTKQKFTIETEYSPENLVAPHISRIHVNHTGEEDKDVLVICQASGSPAPELRWSRLNDKGTYDIVWPGDRHEITQTEDIDFTENQMVIRGVTEADYGTYRCTAANFADTVHQNFDISFVRPENVVAPQLTRLSISQLVSADNDISIICTATGSPAPEMSLMRKNSEGVYEFVFPDERMTIEQDKGVKVTTFSLNIDDPAPYDTGDYACSAANIGGRVQEQFLLNPGELPVTNLERPAVVRINTQAPENRGGDVSLTCVASGTPAPDVNWQAFGQEIEANEKYAIKQTKGIRETLTKLTIRKGSVDDAHPYTCSARNIVGRDSKVYALTIQDVLSAENIHAPHIEHVHLNTTGPEGADATLTCMADGYPAPEMTLLKQSQVGTFERLKSLPSRRVRKFEEGEKSYIQLVISPATKEHAGVYRCSAESAVGAVTQDIQADLPVKVLENAELPHISRIHINRTGHDRADITVTCIARGYPTPEMKWLRFDELVLPRGRFSIQQNKGVNQTVISLTILQAVPEDEGSYRCSAVNFAGSVGQLFDIELQDAVAKYRPHINRIHVNWTGIEHDDLQVTCVASGQAEMSFWKMTDKDYEIVLPLDNIEIDDDKTDDRTILTMMLRRPTPEQAGEYQCLARNPAGEATQPFTLETEVLPVPEDSVQPHVSRIHVNRTGEGDRDIAVTCRVDGIPAPATNWLRRDKTGQFEFVWSDERYSIYEYRDSKGTTLTMTISQPTPADDGIFLCSASNIAGNAHHPFTLNVFEKPPQNQVPPSVKWIHVSRAGPNDEDVVVTCIGVGSPAPEVGLWRRDKEQGDDFLIQVGGRVSVNYTKGTDETTLNVRFLKAQVSDEGTYVCSVANMLGAVKQAFDLHVENTLPTRREIPHISRIHINKTEDGDVMVVCLASGLPRPLMDWLRPNQDGVPKSMEIKNYHVVEIDQVNNTKTFTLIIQQPTALDRGDYYCSARNLAGRVIQKFTVGSEDIPKENLRQPQIVHVHMNMTGDEAADMMLTCLVTGTPPPLLSWWRSYGPGEFKRIWPSPRYQMDGSDTTDGSVLTLVIPKATPEDDGLYRCSAVSVAGSAGQVSRVQLPGGPPENLRSPSIEQVHMNRTSGPGEHLMVTCVAEGNPAPEMRWMREEEDGTFRNVGAHAEDVTIEDYKGEEKSVLTLVVENATPKDWDGMYRCHAVNYAGKTHQDFKLGVQVSQPADLIPPFIDRVHVNSTGPLQDDVMITCRARGVPPPLMNLLLKDDQGVYNFIKPASEEGAIVQEQKDATVLALILTNPPNAGRGSYRCQAANIAGVVREDFDYNTPVLGGEGEQHPHVSRIHVDRAGDFNEDVTVMCKATGNPAPHMNWWKYRGKEFQLVWPGEDVIIEQNDIPDGSQLTMRIRQATSDADGEYLCSAANYVGTAKQRFDFKVFESPPEDLVAAHISWLHFNRTGPYKKGLLITCLAHGNPTPEMRWYKRSDNDRDRLVLPTNDISIEQVSEGRDTTLTLAIDNPADSDGGLYTCEAANVGGTASYNVNAVLSEEPVKDKLPPHITRIHVDRAGDNREHISMYCQASGFPPPDIKWMKDMAPQGRQIDYRYIWPVGRVEAREEKSYNSTTVHLLIKSVEPEDAGNYLCLAANLAGEVQQAFDVHTADKLPENTETPHVEWIHMNRTGINNNDMAITCVARGLPPPEVWFYRGDPRKGTELITPSARNSFYQIQSSAKTTLKLTLRNIRDDDAGPYLCKATNLAGYRSHPFEVVVTEPEIPDQRLPHVSHIRVSRTGIKNQHVLMTCEAEGNPAPELNWWRNEGTADTPQFRLLWPGDKYEIHQKQEAEKTSLSLTIKDVDESTLDTYLCSAANIGGQARQRFELTALPSVKKDEDEPHVERLVVTRTEDSELQLTCSAAGLPPPDIQMYKLDETGAYQLLKPRNRVRFFETNGADSTDLQVTIQQATEKDAGSYLCSASNPLGAAREVTDYTLQDAPYEDEVPPHISHIHMNRTTEDGAGVMVTCLVLGSPAPTVTWWKDYSERGGQDYRLLPPVGTHRIRQEKFLDHTIATLVMPAATQREDGWYRCEATNPWGEVNQEFEVIVQVDMPRVEPPHVTRISVNKTGANKQDLTLTCVASGEPAPGMHFYRQSDDGNFYLVLPASEEDISERRGAGETALQLVIKDFTLEDFGLYRCAAANLGGTVSQTFNVQIDDTPREDQERPYITRIFVDRSGDDPRDVMLTCVANGVPAPQMRWRPRDLSGSDITLPSNRFDVEQVRFEDYSVIVLTIKRATFADDRTFICEAANIVDRVTQPFSLRVFATPPEDLLAPKVSSFYVNQSGADVNMYCVADGQPPPDLYLSKLDATGNYIAVKPRIGLDFTQKKEDQRTILRLHIKDASEANVGDYICTASSLIGTSRRKFEFTVKEIMPVEVQGRPYVRRILVDEPQEGSKVLKVKCFGEGDPSPNMMFFRRNAQSGLDERIKSGGRYKVRKVNLPDGVLLEVKVSDAGPSDTGVYICRAVNKKGTYRTKFNLTVEEFTTVRKGAPEFIQPRVERTGNNGEDVQVTCRARGDPAPDMLFLRQEKDGPETKYQAITTDGRYIVEEKKGEVETVLKVTIRQARSSDAGTYVCSARNRKGSPRQQFTLSIQESLVPIDSQQAQDKAQEQEGRPRFGGVQVLRSGVNDADITVTCQSDGKPAPLMEFFREIDGQFTQIKSGGRYVIYPSYVESGSSLQVVIRQATPEDAGNYMCTSSNIHGKIQQRFTLTIEEQEVQQGQQPSEEDKEWLEQQQRQYRGTTVPPIVPARLPEFRDVQVQRSGPSDAHMTVVCEVRGQPAPSLEIVRYGRSGADSDYTSIQTGGRYTVTRAAIPGGSRLTLIVSDAQAARDRGTYMCIARNPYGTARQQFTLNFQETDVSYRQTEDQVDKVAPSFQDVQVDRAGVNQADVVVMCRVSGSPAPDMRLWRQVTTDGQTDFERIRTGGRYVLDVQKHTGYSILRAEIRDAIDDDAGIYMCGGNNDAGSNRQQFSLTIDKPDTAEEGAPTFEDVKVDRKGSHGEDVVITCIVQGSPAPDIRLWREGTGTDTTSFRGIQTGGRYVVSQNTSGDKTVLRAVIRQATSADAGTYYCSAQNPKGSLRQQFSLTVDDKPSHPEGYPIFEDVQVDRTGRNRDDVVVTCKVNGSPAPTVNLWREVTGPDGTKYQNVRTGGRYTVEQNQYADYSVARAVIRSRLIK
ncbi:hemicentin-1-like [Liolophura sinensis]|uniref:hemicentin-1-like n=1 Tax=Liolophura sinensis TaxID=3198878 RepID=UPI0031589D7E